MSILINGAEMPTPGRYEAVIIVLDKSTAEIAISPEEDDIGYWKEYPLVHVPEHERLGDLDDVINDARHYLCEGCWDYFGLDAKTESCDYCGAMKLIKAIERKPSIIPADKEGE